MRLLSTTAMLACLAFPSVAAADTVVLTPLIGNGVGDTVVRNVTSLISSELEFMAEIDDIEELGSSPATLNTSCLGSASCLRSIAQNAGGDRLITGSIVKKGDDFSLDLVLFDAGSSKIVRRNSFSLNASPESVADGMGPIVRELVTGVRASGAGEGPGGDDAIDFGFDDDFDDMDVDFDASDPEEALEEARRAEELRRQQEEARKAAEEEARRRAEEEARLRAEEEARRRAEDEARRRAEEEARRRQVEEDRMREERRAEEARRMRDARAGYEGDDDDDDYDDEEFDPNSFTLGGSVDDIEVERVEDDRYGSRIDDRDDRRSYYEDEDEILDDLAVLDLDEEERGRSRDSRRYDEDDLDELDGGRGRVSSSEDRGIDRDRDGGGRGKVYIAGRAGYARYFDFNFITGGGEIAIPAGPIHLLVGLEAYTTQRQIPPKFRDPLNPDQETEWNTILPLNAGVVYKLEGGIAVPYFGGDAIFGQYYYDVETGSPSWTVGARARAGLDLMFVENFGLNLNVSLGMWQGKNWDKIQEGIGASGFLPQLSAGTVVAF